MLPFGINEYLNTQGSTIRGLFDNQRGVFNCGAGIFLRGGSNGLMNSQIFSRYCSSQYTWCETNGILRIS